MNTNVSREHRAQREAKIIAQTERLIEEHVDLAVALKRTTFLLSSARLVIDDTDASRLINEQVGMNNALLKRIQNPQPAKERA